MEFTEALRVLQNAILNAADEATATRIDAEISILRDLAVAQKHYFTQVRMNQESMDRAQGKVNEADAKLLAHLSEQTNENP